MIQKSITYNNINLIVNYKKIRSLILKIKGVRTVEVSAPSKISDEKIFKFIDSKISWIIKNENRVQEHINSISKKKYLDGETHYFLGNKYELEIEDSKNYQVQITDKNIVLQIPEATSIGARERLLNSWYLSQLKEIVEDSFKKWELKTGLIKSELIYEKMRGKWGYCNFKTKLISINTEIIKKDIDFIDYVVLHEICHLKVPNHGSEFKNLLNLYLPNWKRIQKID